MREWGIETWRWVAAGVLMGILTVMMVLGIGARRGTPLYRFRLSLWMLVLGMGGAGAGCSFQDITGQPDGATEGVDTRYETCYGDMGTEPPPGELNPDGIMCYEAPVDPRPDGSTDPDLDEEDAGDGDDGD